MNATKLRKEKAKAARLHFDPAASHRQAPGRARRFGGVGERSSRTRAGVARLAGLGLDFGGDTGAMRRAIAFCLLTVTCFAGTATATENWTLQRTTENWTLEGLTEGVKQEWLDMPFIRAWAYAEAIDRYCFPAKSYTKVVGFGLREPARSEDRFSPGTLASAERDAADHLRGEYLACGPAMQFIEDTVARMPELLTTLTRLQLQLNGAKASIAKACAIRARKQSPPPKMCIGGYLPD